MSIFALIVDKEGVEHLNSIKKKLKETNIIKNPFITKIQPIFYKEKEELIEADIISIKPMYPNMAVLVSLISLAGYAITRAWPFALVLALSCAANIFWYKPFYVFMFKLSLKRRGYKGPIKFLSPSEIIEKVYFYEPN